MLKVWLFKFQFHKGTIKTAYRLRHSVAVPFQFHKGTIKTASDLDSKVKYQDFNSIKVRLKPHYLLPLRSR